MAFDFPASPTTGQIYDTGVGVTYKFDGLVWNAINVASPIPTQDQLVIGSNTSTTAYLAVQGKQTAQNTPMLEIVSYATNNGYVPMMGFTRTAPSPANAYIGEIDTWARNSAGTLKDFNYLLFQTNGVTSGNEGGQFWIGVRNGGGYADLITGFNNIVSLPNGRLRFPSSANISSSSNDLDDYEEGTWTPAVTSGTGTITSYTSSGVYTKIGRVVHIQCNINITNNGTGAGSLNVAGLPFTANGDGSCGGREIAVIGYWMDGTINNAQTNISVFSYSNTYPGGTNYQLRLSGTYITSS